MISPWLKHFGSHLRVLAGVLLVTCALSQAQGASKSYQCRALFAGSGVALDEADQKRLSGRMTTIEWMLQQQFANAADPSKVRADQALVQESLSIAKSQLEARGAKTQSTVYEGQPALEILPGNDQWGRIAKAASRIHQTKLLFAPVALAKDPSIASYDGKTEHGRVLNVSFESLAIGPKEELQIHHELGHMDEETRGITPFTGYIASISEESVVRGNRFYSVDMPLDEVPRTVKDLFMRGLNLSRNDMPLNRSRLQAAAVRAREAVLNMSASLSLTNKLRESLVNRPQVVASGPAAQSDGSVWENAAHLTGNGHHVFISKIMIPVHGKEQPSLSLQVQSGRKWTRIALPWSDDWDARLTGLMTNEDNAVFETIDFLVEQLAKREALHRPTIRSTLAAAHFISQNPNADAKALATHAMNPRTDLAPLLVRPPRQR